MANVAKGGSPGGGGRGVDEEKIGGIAEIGSRED